MTKFTVTFTSGATTKNVEADYFKVEQGTLVFRNARSYSSGYPTTVLLVAAGEWRSVEETIDVILTAPPSSDDIPF